MKNEMAELVNRIYKINRISQPETMNGGHQTNGKDQTEQSRENKSKEKEAMQPDNEKKEVIMRNKQPDEKDPNRKQVGEERVETGNEDRREGKGNEESEGENDIRKQSDK